MNLGTTGNTFAVLGGSTVTNTNTPTIVNGNLGVSPGSAITGFPPGIVTGGTIHAGDATAMQAQNDLTSAYGFAAVAEAGAGAPQRAGPGIGLMRGPDVLISELVRV